MESSLNLTKKIAIIGAGVAGLGASWRLQSASDLLKVTLFEKSNTISGRVATRRKDGYFFDNGANYFSTDNPEIEKLVLEKFSDKLTEIPKPIYLFDKNNKISAGDSSKDNKKKYSYTNGIKTFSKLVWEQTKGIELKFEKRISKLTQISSEDKSLKWQLTSTENEDLGVFDSILITAPAPQITEIFQKSEFQKEEDKTTLTQLFGAATYKSIISVAFSLKGRKDIDYYALLNTDREHSISWLSFENDKKGHVPDDTTVVIVQMADGWSKQYYETKDAEITEKVFELTKALLGDSEMKERLIWADVKKWKFALPDKAVDSKAFEIGRANNLYFAGDFVRGKGRVLDAFEEGIKNADTIIGSYKPKL